MPQRQRRVPQASLSSREGLSRHIRFVHRGLRPAYSCHECRQVFTSAVKLEKHKVLVHSFPKSMCDKCGKSFDTVAAVRKHVRDQHTSSPVKYECPVCEKSYDTRKYYELHVQTAHPHASTPDEAHRDQLPGGGRFQCGVCFKFYSNNICLRQHIRYMHSGAQGSRKAARHVCGECGRRYQTSCGLQTHQRTVHALVRYSCGSCSLAYTTKHQLDLHLASKHPSEAERSYPCGQCPKSFTHPSLLRRHRRTAHNLSSFQCSQCPKIFPRRYDLKKHETVHSGTKDHVCAKCLKQFRFAHHLRRHMDNIHKEAALVTILDDNPRSSTSGGEATTHAGGTSTRGEDDVHEQVLGAGDVEKEVEVETELPEEARHPHLHHLHHLQPESHHFQLIEGVLPSRSYVGVMDDNGVAAEDQGIMQVACDDQEMLSPMQTHRSVLH